MITKSKHREDRLYILRAPKYACKRNSSDLLLTLESPKVAVDVKLKRRNLVAAKNSKFMLPKTLIAYPEPNKCLAQFQLKLKILFLI